MTRCTCGCPYDETGRCLNCCTPRVGTGERAASLVAFQVRVRRALEEVKA